MTTITPTTHDHRIGLLRAAATGAASLLLLFVLCWIGARLGVPVTHLGIQAFTFASVDSTQALLEGGGWSVVVGAVAGFVIAFFYNLFGRR
jgi:hypothetical protein